MTKINNLRTKKITGFTLVEILVVGAILVVLAGGATLLLRDVLFLGASTQNKIDMQFTMQKVLRDFTKEVRTAKPSINGSFPIADATKDTLTVYTDTAGNDGIPEKIKYLHQESKLIKETYVAEGSPLVYPDEPTTTTTLTNIIANNGIGEDIFSYFSSGEVDESTKLISPFSISSVQYIKMTIVLDSDQNMPPDPVIASTGVTVRNIKGDL